MCAFYFPNLLFLPNTQQRAFDGSDLGPSVGNYLCKCLSGLKYPTQALNWWRRLRAARDWSTTAYRGNLLRSLRNTKKKNLLRQHIKKTFLCRNVIFFVSFSVFGIHKFGFLWDRSTLLSGLRRTFLRLRATKATIHSHKQDSRDDRKVSKLLLQNRDINVNKSHSGEWENAKLEMRNQLVWWRFVLEF